MPSISLRAELAGVARQDRATALLHEQVGKLYLEARDDVYRYLLSLGLYPPQAQETAQDVFLRLYEARKKGEQIENERGWIFRVAHNLGLRVRSKQSQHQPFDADLTGVLEGKLRGSEPDPEERLIERERDLRFQRAVDQLSDQQKRCLLLRLEGLRYPEIGSVLGIGASTAGEFLRRAIKQLQKGGL